jgi:hypothetical protein
LARAFRSISFSSSLFGTSLNRREVPETVVDVVTATGATVATATGGFGNSLLPLTSVSVFWRRMY